VHSLRTKDVASVKCMGAEAGGQRAGRPIAWPALAQALAHRAPSAARWGAYRTP
ncbi:hypothetical protein HAX54_013309, partial [Datura stramonium]|nr:hypothetical protein [Datura stramonium]